MKTIVHFQSLERNKLGFEDLCFTFIFKPLTQIHTLGLDPCMTPNAHAAVLIGSVSVHLCTLHVVVHADG